MKELQGRAAGELDLPPDECFELLSAVERYPDWIEFVREVELLERERRGKPARAWAALHIPQSPFGTDFELFVAVRTKRPGMITLTRVPQSPNDRDRLELIWRMSGNGSTRLELEFDAAASFVPGFVPMGGAGEALAQAGIDAVRDALTR